MVAPAGLPAAQVPPHCPVEPAPGFPPVCPQNSPFFSWLLFETLALVLVQPLQPVGDGSRKEMPSQSDLPSSIGGGRGQFLCEGEQRICKRRVNPDLLSLRWKML